MYKKKKDKLTKLKISLFFKALPFSLYRYSIHTLVIISNITIATLLTIAKSKLPLKSKNKLSSAITIVPIFLILSFKIHASNNQLLFKIL